MTNPEIISLIKLLDDPDVSVFNAVRDKLSQIGVGIIPHLEEAWENSLDTLFQTRIEEIIHDVHQSHIKHKLTIWSKNNQNDLLEGAVLIAQFQYPNIIFIDIKKQVDLIKSEIWLELNENLTALEKIKIVNHIFFDKHKYSRGQSTSNNIQSLFINNALNTKKASHITLAIIYAIVCQQLNLPVYGVALSRNFILCYKDEMQTLSDEELTEGVLFYINPFNKGVVFGRKEIEFFIKQQKLEHQDTYFLPISNKITIISLVNEIITLYNINSDKTKVEEYRSLLNILYF